MGRVARLGLGSGSGGIGGDGSAGAACGARSDRYGLAVSKSGETLVESGYGLEDRADGASTWRTSGEGWTWRFVGKMLAIVAVEGC